MTAITDILNVKAPKLYKSKLDAVECANPDLVLGLEIEVEGCARNHDFYSGELNSIWDVKTDGSLRGINNGQMRAGGNAFEFISKPAQLKILIPELKKFYEVTQFTDANFSDRCSVHVHSNITDLTVHQMGTVFLTYSVVEDVLLKFINHYKVDDPRGKYRDTNIYCVPWNQCRMNYDIMSRMFADADYAFKQWQKYTALNILPTRTLGTVEWRHMHGSADVEKLTLWLNLIGRIYKYAVENKFEDAVETIKKLNDNSAYQQYFQAVFGNYLTYSPEVAKELEAGVVNAKYAMMNLKDYTVAPKKKKTALEQYAEGAGLDLDAIEEANEAIRADWAAPAGGGGLGAFNFQAAPAQPAPMARNQVRAGVGRAAPRPAPVRLDPLRTPAAADALSRDLAYPLERGHYRDARGNIMWGIKDALGRGRFSDGTRVPVGQLNTFTPENAAVSVYVRGVGGNFWTVVDAGYRLPPAAVVEGGF